MRLFQKLKKNRRLCIIKMAPPYDILLSEETLKMLLNYKLEVSSNHSKSGNNLKIQLSKDISLDKISNEDFFQVILSTKKICCFAESEIKGDGSDWNKRELRILGNISIAMNVQVFDNGVWSISGRGFRIHHPPMAARLIFTPGPLLEGDSFLSATPDFEDVSFQGQIVQERYNDLLMSRLFTVFLYADQTAKEENKKALIVLPGLGCGQFAGKFKGEMGEHLNLALKAILTRVNFLNVSCVRFDPFDECTDFELKINNIKYRVRRNVGPLGKSQLCAVEDYEETKGEFRDCTLYKVVAWDHASLPGNDYFMGSRSTDDGVTAAATNSMEVLTGVKGSYSRIRYFMPDNYHSWMSVASENDTKLVVDGNFKVALKDRLVELSQYFGQTQRDQA